MGCILQYTVIFLKSFNFLERACITIIIISVLSGIFLLNGMYCLSRIKGSVGHRHFSNCRPFFPKKTKTKKKKKRSSLKGALCSLETNYKNFQSKMKN